MTGPLLLPLACPSCGRDGQGAGASRVYFCAACGKAWHMARPGRHFPFWYARAARPGRPELYAPFWRVEGETSIETDSETKARAYRNAKPLGPMFFPAFWTLRAMNHENLTLRYALAEEPPGPDPEGQGPVLPGILDPSSLQAVARLTWLGYLDRLADVTGVQATFEVRSVSYVAVPFFRAGSGWADGILGLAFPASYFSAAHS